MRAEIVSIGSELLLGQIVDTNGAFIARHLASIGIDVFHKVTVGDNVSRAAEALEQALGRAQVVITTGGLGPTEDDVTRDAVGQATGRDLVFVAELLAQIETFFRARGLPPSPSNRKQAFIPRDAIPLANPVGTAPCFIVEQGDRALISLPGVPREMEHLLLTRVIPYLQERYGLAGAIVSRIIRVAGLGESRVGEALGDLMARGANPTVGTMAHLGQVDVRIAAKGTDPGVAEALIAPVELEVRRRLGDVVFGVDGETLEGVVVGAMGGAGLTATLVEAGSGGAAAERLTSVPGGAARVQGLVLEARLAAGRLGARSPSAADLAEAARTWGLTDLGVAVVLQPPEGSGPSFVQVAEIAVAIGSGVTSQEHRFGGDLRQIRVRAQIMTLDAIRRALLRRDG